MTVQNNLPFPAAADPTYSPPDSDTFPSPDELESTCYGDSYSSLSEYKYASNGLDSNGGPCFSRPGESVDTTGLNWTAPVPNGFISPPAAVVGAATHGMTTTNPQFTMWQTGVPTPLSTSAESQQGYIPPDYSSARFPSVPSPLPTPTGHGSPVSLSPVTTNPIPSPEDPNLKPPPRKRGRPRIHRPASEGSATSPAKAARTQCMPHTEVERKYREKLNAELERLRKAVPMLPQSDPSDSGGVKPSKSMVLAVAIDYIKELERQRDIAVEEVERLGGKVKFGRPGSWRKDSDDT